MSEKPTHEPHPGLSRASGGARALAVELRALEKLDTYTRGRGDRYRIKMAALDLLSCCGTPAPLVLLFRQLMKDDRTSAPPQQTTRITDAQYIAAEIEGNHDWDNDHLPSKMNDSEVARAVASEIDELKEMEVLNIDVRAPARTTIRKWRQAEWYEELVFSYRPGFQYTPARTPTSRPEACADCRTPTDYLFELDDKWRCILCLQNEFARRDESQDV